MDLRVMQYQILSKNEQIDCLEQTVEQLHVKIIKLKQAKLDLSDLQHRTTEEYKMQIEKL